MKKLFTLALVLMVTVAGYSQVRTVSHKDTKKAAATMQQAPRMEAMNVLENVQSQPNMTRTDGELDYTTYDWQSNDGARSWTIVWPDGKINFAFTCATDNSFSDRGTAVGTYDAVNDEWIPCGGRVEPEKTGFGSIARYGQNSIVVAAHTASEMGVYMIADKDNISGGSAEVLPKLNNTNEPTWPAVMTSGPNRDIIHIVALGYNDNMIYYFRSKDGGETYDKENVILPYLTSEYGGDWNSNCYYWMETTEDNCLALVINNSWSDGMVLYSYDDGDTWERKVFYKHPGPNSDMGELTVAYPRWTSCQWGTDGQLCLAYEFNGTTGEPGSGSYYPSMGGVAFWSETMPYRSAEYAQFGYDPNNEHQPVQGQPFVMDSAYIYQDIYASWPLFSDGTHQDEGMLPEYMGYLCALTDNGEWESWDDATDWKIDDRGLHGAYNAGCVAMPVLAMVPGSNGFDMVAVWSCMDENNTDESGNFYFKLFAAYSGDGGLTWTHPYHLTNDFLFTYSECVYSQAVVVGTNLIIACQMDSQTGTYVQGDEGDPSDNLYQGLTFDLVDLFGPTVNVPEVVNNKVNMNIYPNPAVDQLNVQLSKNADMVIYNIMGQVVRTQEGHVGGNTIDLNGLNAGVYFIGAGADTQKFIVK